MYVFKYRKGFFWKKLKAKGHKLDQELNRMDVFLTDGGVYSINNWHEYELKLGRDWWNFTKTEMEKEAGQDIKTI